MAVSLRAVGSPLFLPFLSRGDRVKWLNSHRQTGQQKAPVLFAPLVL
jgi:hypothetical protein